MNQPLDRARVRTGLQHAQQVSFVQAETIRSRNDFDARGDAHRSCAISSAGTVAGLLAIPQMAAELRLIVDRA